GFGRRLRWDEGHAGAVDHPRTPGREDRHYRVFIRKLDNVELRGEKIDIIEFSDDPVQFATHALSPAKISRVTILEPVEHHMEVIVDDSQLSLAIGKKGQNVRLAARLLGWKID